MHGLLASVTVLTCLWQAANSVTVHTTRGAVHGLSVNFGNSGLYYGKADAFLGIPFAQPPIGDLRFKLPRPICNYPAAGINATVQPSTCPSTSGSFRPDFPSPPANPRNEDCLYLNVITPSANFGGPRPVIFYIYGGGLNSGSASNFPYKGIVRQFASRGVVIVIAQYRLGVLGWFTTFSPEFPANLGMYDMITALKWVQEEIGAFGGDPNKVTLAGESAGAYAVSALSLSPAAQGLFQQTIQVSGGATAGIDFPDTPNGSPSKGWAKALCNFTESQWATGNFAPLVTCLQNKPWEQLITPTGLRGLGFGIDGVLLPDSLTKLAESRPIRPALLGDMRDEASGFFGLTGDAPGVPADLSRFSAQFIANYIIGQYPVLTANISLINDIVLRTYSPGFHPPASGDGRAWLQLASKAISDVYIAMGVRREANWQISAGNPNLYLFTYDYWSAVGQFYGNFTLQGWKPVPHAVSNPFTWLYTYVWDPALNASTVSNADIKIIDFLADTWTNFAKHGRPKRNGWPAVSSKDEMEFYRIRSSKGRMERHFRQNSHVVFSAATPAIVGEFPSETMSAAARAALDANYVPAVSAEFAAANVLCDVTRTSPTVVAEKSGQARLPFHP